MGRPRLRNTVLSVENGVAHIELPGGHVCSIDAADLPRVIAFRWSARWAKTNQSYYVVGWTGLRVERLHRFLLGAGAGMQVDHANLNTLDNRRENLRPTSQGPNKANTRGYRRRVVPDTTHKGVYRRPNKRSPWCANIQVDHRRVWLGSFATEAEAIDSYHVAVRQLRGEFARCNCSGGIGSSHDSE